MDNDVKPIRFSLKLAYATPALMLAVIGIPVYVYLPKFYTDTVGINISTVGLMLLLVRLFDAVTDPVVGYVSDRTRTPFGRRRPYMAIGAIGLAVSMYFLFNPLDSGTEAQTVWFGVWLFLLFLFWTIVTVPYESLGPEITYDYHERTTLFSLRDGFLILGTLIAAASPALAAWLIGVTGGTVTERLKFFSISVLYAPLIVAGVWFCVWRIREKRFETGPADTGFIRGLSDVVRNRPFLILLAAYTISAFGSNLPATLILYYVQYVLRAEGAELFLMLYFLTGILFLPVWIRISRRIGKKSAWLLSMAINTGAFFGVFFLGAGDVYAYGILVFLSGIGFGAGLAIPSSMQADVIDVDEMVSGKRREGRYIGLWSISKKLAAAFGVGIGLFLLGSTGYKPNVVQSDDVVFMLRVLYALVPCLCNLVAFGIAMAYPITEERHREVRRTIDARRTAQAIS